MPFMTKTKPNQAPAQPNQKPKMWGDPGVSEGFLVQDQQIIPSPAKQPLTLADAGILEEIRHHVNLQSTITHGTGTNAKDIFGPYNFTNTYELKAGSNTPLVSVTGKMLNPLQIMEYPSRSWEASADPATVQDPLTNVSDYFGYSSTAGSAQVFRHWYRIPVSLRWAGMPGGAVGFLVLQNKKIANVITATFAMSGGAPYSIGSTVAGAAPYLLSGNDTVTATGTYETWKKLWTVPDSRAQFPVYGFVRYIQEVSQGYASGSFTYNFEPGGVLLRAAFWFYDATVAGGMATANLNTITYQYGTNKQLDVYTPYANIHQQLETYGRALPQGMYVFDYYTQTRNLVNAKSTENVANVQVVANFAQGYSVPANSQCYILLDKVYIVQNYLANA